MPASCKIAGNAALVVGVLFLLPYVGVPGLIADSLTELAFLFGLCVAVWHGDGGGLFSLVQRFAASSEGSGSDLAGVRDLGVVVDNSQGGSHGPMGAEEDRETVKE